MPKAIPTLGYPTRTAACLALKAEGHTTAEVARRVGIAVETAAALICSGERATKPYGGYARTIVIGSGTLDALRPAALARGLSVNALVRALIEEIADSGLVGAVLDDGKGEG